MLNPDGVKLGNTRSDSNGVNLNSIFGFSNKKDHPSVFGLEKLIGFLHKDSKINFYFDLHSHFTKRGLFVFGNPLTKENYKNVLKFPFLYSKKEKEFNIENSGFGNIKENESTSRKLFF